MEHLHLQMNPPRSHWRYLILPRSRPSNYASRGKVCQITRRRRQKVKRKGMGIKVAVKELKKARRHRSQLERRVNHQRKKRKWTANAVMNSVTVVNSSKLLLISISIYRQNTKLPGCVVDQIG